MTTLQLDLLASMTLLLGFLSVAEAQVIHWMSRRFEKATPRG